MTFTCYDLFMCLILFALRRHPDYPLIVAANRDEYFQRPTEAANFWQDQPAVLAGRDLQAGGTWLGINRSGQFAAVTNVRNGRETPNRPGSRGALVSDYLTAQQPGQFQPQHGDDHYNGFNLLTGTPASLLYRSNRGNQALYELPAGVYGLSNGHLNGPWPKVTSGRQQLQQLLNLNWQQLAARQQDLLSLLTDTRRYPLSMLPDTGVSDEMEVMLSSRFIISDSEAINYGTRASTLVLFHRSGRIDFIEHSFDAQGPSGTEHFTLQTPAPSFTLDSTS